MKRALVISALAAVVGAQAQTTIFDNVTPPTVGYTTTSSSPRFMLGDSFGVLSSGGAGWALTGFRAAFFVFSSATPTTFTNVTGTWRFYNDVSTSTTATDPAFNNLAGTVTLNLGTVTQTTANQVFVLNNVDITSLGITLTDGIKGMDVAFQVGGVGTEAITMAMRDVAPAVGTTPTPANGFWRDNDNNGVINVGDARTLGTGTNLNPGLVLTANAVPEPASMAALGLGALALIRRRRNKK